MDIYLNIMIHIIYLTYILIIEDIHFISGIYNLQIDRGAARPGGSETQKAVGCTGEEEEATA